MPERGGCTGDTQAKTACGHARQHIENCDYCIISEHATTFDFEYRLPKQEQVLQYLPAATVVLKC